eukprot:Blabericola_migrator_1__5197@NODE_267_length_10594_cov_56_602451_g223_i0_p1_GENE_NODE_267_length_10594_cov_56_602451_g223_i0NODE_267_length_10594_cov_56_602451_g223_i0_p1_ORF_typecomplete_len522_score30_33_NODE_267_length_10594_cov_56_602451_g223_i0681633
MLSDNTLASPYPTGVKGRLNAVGCRATPQDYSLCPEHTNLVCGLDPATADFQSPIVQVLLCWEARRFAAYCTIDDFWVLRQVSRVFRDWALSWEIQLSVLLPYIWDPPIAFSEGASRLQGLWKERIIAARSWLAFVRQGVQLLRKCASLLSLGSLRPVGPPWEDTGLVEWHFQYDQDIEGCNKRLLFLCHFPGPDRYYTDTLWPKHNLKLATLIARNPNSRLPSAESVSALIEGLLGSNWSTQAVLTREIVPAGQFDAVRDCLPYASEPELHIISWICRACLCHPQLREELFSSGSSRLSPFEVIVRIKTSMERLMELLEACEIRDEEECSIDGSDYNYSDDTRSVCSTDETHLGDTVLIMTQPFARGVLALPPSEFWSGCLSPTPLPELTEELEAQYTRLAESYIKKKRPIKVISEVPWFGVSNLVIKGATIAHQLHQLDLMGQTAMKHDILAPFERVAPSVSHHYLRVQVSALRDTPADHPGDVCTLYIGPKGALMFTCNHKMLAEKMTMLGWSPVSLV